MVRSCSSCGLCPRTHLPTGASTERRANNRTSRRAVSCVVSCRTILCVCLTGDLGSCRPLDVDNPKHVQPARRTRGRVPSAACGQVSDITFVDLDLDSRELPTVARRRLLHVAARINQIRPDCGEICATKEAERQSSWNVFGATQYNVASGGADAGQSAATLTCTQKTAPGGGGDDMLDKTLESHRLRTSA